MDNQQCGDGYGSERQLYSVIRSELEKKEVLKKIKAKMRAEVVEIVRFGDMSVLNEAPSTRLTSPSCMLNHLILEYFEWMNFHYTSEMLSSESGLKKRANREALEQLLNSRNGFDKDLPILFDILMRFIKTN